MGDSYREELRKTRTGPDASKSKSGVVLARQEAIRRAAVRKKHGAVARTAAARLAATPAETQVRMF